MITLNLPNEVSSIVEPEEFIDNGTQGSVWKVKKKSIVNLADGKVYAMKILKDETLDPTIRKNIENELKLLSQISCPYITNLDFYLWIRNTAYIIMEYCPNHTLLRVIVDAQEEGRSLAEEEIWKYAIQIILALESLHANDFIHRDIKPQNILLDVDKNIKLADFGLSRHSCATSVAGTLCFYSPRSCSQLREDAQTKESDIWAFGCTLYCLCNLNFPFNGNPHQIKTKSHDPISDRYSNELKSLVNRCLEKERCNRPTISDILANEFIVRKAIDLGISIPNDSKLRNNPNYYKIKGNALKLLGKRELAIECYQQSIKIDPNQPDIYNCIAIILQIEKKYEEAVEYYNHAIRIDPNCAVYYENKGKALNELGRSEDAIECYQDAIRIDPTQDVACNSIGFIFYKKKRYEEALKYYNDAIRINPNKADYYSNKGYVLYDLERKDEAMECYQQAIAIDQNQFSAYSGIGLICYEENRYEEALKYINNSITINPNRIENYENKGCILYDLGRRDEAIECYQNAIRIDLNRDAAYSGLGFIFYKGEKYEEAVKYFNDAIRINPNYAEYYEVKGFALKNLGRREESEMCFCRARELSQA